MGAKADIDRFELERSLRRAGSIRIAGVDEAGRGPLAGPVVAAAVVFPAAWFEPGVPDSLAGLNDSKQLTVQQREDYFGVLISLAEIQFAIVSVEAPVIDEINILQATHRAMNEALARLDPKPDHVLVDGRQVGTMRFRQTAVIKGDTLSYSIAAASVLAKVTRDRKMLEHHERWPTYGFAEHKGYGTPQHLAALAEHGPCPIHRRTFAPLTPVQGELL